MFSQDMIERWIASSLYPGDDIIKVVEHEQDELDDTCKQINC